MKSYCVILKKSSNKTFQAKNSLSKHEKTIILDTINKINSVEGNLDLQADTTSIEEYSRTPEYQDWNYDDSLYENLLIHYQKKCELFSILEWWR